MEQQRQDEAEGSDCLEWDHFPLHSASSSSLRRPMGSRRQSSEEVHVEAVLNLRLIVVFGEEPSDEIAGILANRIK